MIEPAENFDWASDDSIVVHEQLAVAVYSTVGGGVLIRQERCWDEDSDMVIIIRPECVKVVAEAMLAAAVEAHADNERPTVSSAAANSAAKQPMSENANMASDQPSLALVASQGRAG